MISRVYDFINSLDCLNLFGYVPKFTIKRKECYKSEFGAVIYLVYSVMFLYYMIGSTVDYVQNLNEVDTIKIFSSDSQNYRITTNDLYFGIGLFTNVTKDISEYSGLQFGLNYTQVDQNGNKTNTQFNLVPCLASNFYSPNEWNNFTSARQAFLNNWNVSLS